MHNLCYFSLLTGRSVHYHKTAKNVLDDEQVFDGNIPIFLILIKKVGSGKSRLPRLSLSPMHAGTGKG